MEKVGTELGFCSETVEIWQLIGYLILIFKIVLPIILIIVGILTLGKAVITDDEKEAKKCFNSMIIKFITAIVIFFIPSIVSAGFKLLRNFSDVKEDYTVCEMCVICPRGSFCNDKVAEISHD